MPCTVYSESRPALTSTKDALTKTDPILGILTYMCFPETVEVRCTVRHYVFTV